MRKTMKHKAITSFGSAPRRGLRFGAFFFHAAAALSLAVLVLLSGCSAVPGAQPERPGTQIGNNATQNQNETPLDGTDSKALPAVPPAPPADWKPEPETITVRVIAVGDIMMHEPQIPAGYDEATGTYQYDSFFTEVKPILSQGDFVIGNLETPLAGKENGGYSGYPMFNAPDALADALKTAGFTMLTTANNHAMDRGAKGVLHTLQTLNERGFVVAGTAPDAEEAALPKLQTKNGVALGLLAYTFGTNGIPVPEDKPYLVNRIDEAAIVRDIERTRAAGADIVAVALHFGDEYQLKPNAMQINLAEICVKAGADLVLGSHPHVVQPNRMLEVEGYDGKPHKGYVIYSMGNFISNQRDDFTEYGVITDLTLTKHLDDGHVTIDSQTALPTWVHRYADSQGKRHYRVLPLEKTITDKTDSVLPVRMYEELSVGLSQIKEHLKWKS